MLSKAASSTIFIAFGMTQPGIEPGKVAVHSSDSDTDSSDSDTDFFKIVARVLQRDTLTAIQFIICLDYVL